MKYFLSLTLGLGSLFLVGSSTARPAHPPVEKLCATYHQAVGTCTYKDYTVRSRSACYALVELKDILWEHGVEFSEEEIICEEHRVPD